MSCTFLPTLLPHISCFACCFPSNVKIPLAGHLSHSRRPMRACIQKNHAKYTVRGFYHFSGPECILPMESTHISVLCLLPTYPVPLFVCSRGSQC
jgi:hypothetical protein